MEEFDMPIFKKTYSLYKEFYGIRSSVSKQDRYTVYLRVENSMLEIIEGILLASQQTKIEKSPTLEKVSLNLNFLRVLIRLMKDVKAIDIKKYSTLEESIDEIGRMLGGWIKSTKEA
ncbi:MAG: diversity-generating retroelement protein Avd [Candidatus Berkelbacteria bacterium]|nr:diversity-generating retroelement protein Avd [Candidatus Berkelbacteria bacterium]